MNTAFLILGLALLGAFMNSFLRGGWWKTLFPDYYEKHDWSPFDDDIPNALGYAIVSGFIAHSWVIGLLMGLAMFAGSAPAIFNEKEETAFNFKRKKEWVFHVIIRGLYWSVPLALVTGYFYNWTAGLIFLCVALTMPISYSYNWWYKDRDGHINPWTLSEITFGVFLWVPLFLL